MGEIGLLIFMFVTFKSRNQHLWGGVYIFLKNNQDTEYYTRLRQIFVSDYRLIAKGKEKLLHHKNWRFDF